MEIRLKRFLSLAMAIVMVIGMMPTNIVFATENGEDTPLDQNVVEETTAATSEPVVTEHTCVYTAEEVTKAATCTETGSKTLSGCSCGVNKTEEISALGHSHAEEVTKEATCTETGVKTFTCGTCGDTYTEEIPVIGHNYVDGKCACGAVCEHVWTDEEREVSNGSCLTCGYICKHDGETHVETIPATCTEPGCELVVCDICTASIAGTELPKADHVYVDGVCSCNAVAPDGAFDEGNAEGDEVVTQVQEMLDALPDLPPVVKKAELEAYQAKVNEITAIMVNMTKEQTDQLTGLEKLYPNVTLEEAALPQATVTVRDPMVLTAEEHDYMAWPSGDKTIDRPLQIVMNFKAQDTLEQATASGYGKYKCDFYLTVSDLANGSLTADGCYLAGNYGTFGWIVIPADGLVIESGVSYPVVSGYDANITYEQICDSVRDFTAAIFIHPDLLAAHPDMKVQLELKMVNPDDPSDVLVIGEPAVYDVADLLAGTPKDEPEEPTEDKAPIVIPENIENTITTSNPGVAEDVVTNAVDEIKNNTALKEESYNPIQGVANVVAFEVSLKDMKLETKDDTTETVKIVFNVVPKNAEGSEVHNPETSITFRLPVPDSWDWVKVTHGTDVTTSQAKEVDGSKYVEVTSATFSEFTAESTTAPVTAQPAASINGTGYDTLEKAFAAAFAAKGAQIKIVSEDPYAQTDAQVNFTEAGTYTVTGGNGMMLPGIIMQSAGNVNFEIKDAYVTAGKLISGSGSKLNTGSSIKITNSIVDAGEWSGDGFDGASWWTMWGNSSTEITNSTVGANIENGMTGKGGISGVAFGANNARMHFATAGSAKINGSTVISGFFQAADRGEIIVDDSNLYIGGGLIIGRDAGGNESWHGTSADGFRADKAATVKVTDSKIVNIGWGNGNDGKGLRIGSLNIGNLVLDNSDVIFSHNKGKNCEDAYITAGSTLTMSNNSTLVVGTLNVADGAVITIDASAFAGGENLKVIEQTDANAASLKGKVKVNNLPDCTIVSYEDGDVTLVAVPPVAKIGERKYGTFADALNAVQDGQTITLVEGAVGDESGKEIDFEKAISFTITGKAPEYVLPVVTFQNATVNIQGAEIKTAELDARQNATINVIDSTVHSAGGNPIVKSYYNGAINISGTSKVYTHQMTTMGYITISDSAQVHVTWKTNVYGNGMITVKNSATLATASLQLTGQDYSGRDNTDADRAGKPASIIVDGANFTVGKVFSEDGKDYSYETAKYGINIGTEAGKSAVLDIKNGANVQVYQFDKNNGNNYSYQGIVTIGAGGTVNVDGSTFSVACRQENGEVTLTNNGRLAVQGNSKLNISTLTGTAVYVTDDATLTDTVIGGAVYAGYGANKTASLKLTISGSFTANALYVGNKYENYPDGEVHELTITDGAVVNLASLYVRPTCVATVTNATVNTGDLLVRGSMTVDGSTMSYQSAIGGGTGHWVIYEDDDASKTASLTLNNSTVSTNYLTVGQNSNSNSDADSNAKLTVNGGSLTLNYLRVLGADAFANNVASFNNATLNAKTAFVHEKAAVLVSGTSDIAANVTGAGWVYMNGVALDSDTKLYGAKVGFINGTNNVVGSIIKDGFFSVGIGQNAAAEATATFAAANNITLGDVTVNVSGDAVIGGNGATYSGWVGSAFGAAKDQHNYVLNVENSMAAFGYLHVSKDGMLNVVGHSTNKYTHDNANVDFYAGDFIINGEATFNDTDAWVKYTKVSVDHAGGVLNIVDGTNYEASIHNGSNTGTSLEFYKLGTINVYSANLEIDNGATIKAGGQVDVRYDSTLTANGKISNEGTITMDTTSYITGAELVGGIVIDTTDMTEPEPIEVITLTGNYEEDEITVKGNAAKHDDNGVISVYFEAMVQGENSWKGYATLADAVAAAQDGEMVLLTRDVTLDKIIIVEGKSISIGNLNGEHTITAKVADAFTVRNGGVLDLDWLKVNSVAGILWAEANGTINVNGGELKTNGRNSVTAAAYAEGAVINIRNAVVASVTSSAITAQNKGVINVYDSHIETTHRDFCAGFSKTNGVINLMSGTVMAADNYSLIAAAGGEVNIFGGNVMNGVKAHENANAKANISGGSIYGNVATANGAEIFISGGWFDNDPKTDPNVELADGMTWTNDNKQIHHATYVAFIDADQDGELDEGENGFETLTAAIAAAQPGEAVALLNTVNEAVEIEKSITIDVNGYILADQGTETEGAAINIKSGDVTVTDSTTDHNGGVAQMGNGHGILVAEGASLTLNTNVQGFNAGIKTMGGNVTVMENGGVTATNPNSNCGDGIRAYGNAVVTLNGGHVSALTESGYGIELYQNAKAVINDGAYVSGMSAICVYGGTLVVNDGNIVGGSEYAIVTSTNGAASIINNADVTINGGNISGQVVVEKEYDGYPKPDGYTASVKITNGNFNKSGNETELLVVEDDTYAGYSMVVSGGYYATSINPDYLAPGYRLEENSDGSCVVVSSRVIDFVDYVNSENVDLNKLYVDGYPVWYFNMSVDGKIEIPDELAKKSKMFITSYKYSPGEVGEYPINMYVWLAEGVDENDDGLYDNYTTAPVEDLTDFFQYHGTSIRVDGSNNGIRFFSSIDPELQNALISGTNDMKMTFAGTEFWRTEDNKKRSEVYGGAAGSNFRVFTQSGGRNWFTGVLTNLGHSDEIIVAPINSRPYAVLEIDGVQVTLYGGILTRSIYDVAKQNTQEGTPYYDYVTDLIARGDAFIRDHIQED